MKFIKKIVLYIFLLSPLYLFIAFDVSRNLFLSFSPVFPLVMALKALPLFCLLATIYFLAELFLYVKSKLHKDKNRSVLAGKQVISGLTFIIVLVVDFSILWDGVANYAPSAPPPHILTVKS